MHLVLSYLVSLAFFSLSSTEQNIFNCPAFMVRFLSVSCLFHFYSSATSGRNVLLLLSSNSSMIPCFPISQSSKFFLFEKFTRKETETDSFYNSDNAMGINLLSSNALNSVYCWSTLLMGWKENVPMHPLSSSWFLCQVTNKGAAKSSNWLGNLGSGNFLSEAIRLSKQK